MVLVVARKHLSPECNEQKRGYSNLPDRKELYFCKYETHMIDFKTKHLRNIIFNRACRLDEVNHVRFLSTDRQASYF
jgi:hypothetical protein